MSEEPSTPTTDEFQHRVEELGLTEGHWRDVGERFHEYREKGMDPKDAILTAVDDFSHEDADLEALRRAWLREQHKFNDVEHTVEVEVPADVRDAIRKRMALFGETPEDNPDEWTDLALDSVTISFTNEPTGNHE
jgi:hypothetical protein